MANSTTTVASGGGVSIIGLLGLLFIGLKLANVIAWSWVWVLAPFWIPFALAIVFLIVGFAAVLIGHALSRR